MCAGRRTAGSAARATHPTAGLLPHGSRRANGLRRPPRPGAARRRSRCGYTPAASTTRRYRLRSGRSAEFAGRASPSAPIRRRADSRTAAPRGSHARPARPCGSPGSGRRPTTAARPARRAAVTARPGSPAARAAWRDHPPPAPGPDPDAGSAPRGWRSAPRASRTPAGCCAIAAWRAARTGGSRWPRPPRHPAGSPLRSPRTSRPWCSARPARRSAPARWAQDTAAAARRTSTAPQTPHE